MILKHKVVLITILTLFGVVLSSLGHLSFPICSNLSYFWPAAFLQSVAPILFGLPGVIASVIFPTLSNWIIKGGTLYSLGYVPANIVQSSLPLIFYRWYNVDDSKGSWKHLLFFIFFGALIPQIAGALTGAFAMVLCGEYASFPATFQMMTVWLVGNIPSIILFGFPIMIFSSPMFKERTPAYENYAK